MSRRLPAVLAVAAAMVAAAVILAAAWQVALTPDRALGDGLVPPPARAKPGNAEVSYTLPRGRSAADVGNDLAKLGVIPSAGQFSFLVRLMGVEDRLSAGEYDLHKGSSAISAIEAVTVREAVPVLRVTFPEGIRAEEMAVRAEKAGFGTQKDFMDAVRAAKLPAPFAATLPEGASIQGYLFPDTYILPKGATAAQLVDKMLQTFARRFTPSLVAAATVKGLTPHQAVTLASIVEREAVIDEERRRIAGVFLNRLAASDLLGADPTVQFAVALDPASVQKYGWWKKELTAVDLKLDSPYNTRLKPGLPPGPITNPGWASLEAVANAEPTKFYYFVADAKKGDGSHVFAVTEAEHLANIARVGAP